MEMSLSFTAGQFVGDDLWVSVLDGGRVSTSTSTPPPPVRRRSPSPCGPGVPALVRERPPGRRHQVAAHQRPLRRGTRDHGALRRRRPAHAPCALPPQHHRGDEPAGLPAAAHQGRRRRHHRGRAPRQPPAVDSGTPSCGSCDVDERGTFDVAAVEAALDAAPRPARARRHRWLQRHRLAARPARHRRRGPHSAASSSWSTARSSSPHRPVDITALGVDVIAFSGHKMYAPFGAGALIAPRAPVRRRGAVPRRRRRGAAPSSFDDVVWADGPDREDAGSPNVLGVVALTAAADELRSDGWSSVLAHEEHLVRGLDSELASVPGLRRLGPVTGDRLPVAAFNLDGVPHGLLAARLANEYAIGTRSGCFCAHPYMGRLLGLSDAEVDQFHADVRAGQPAPSARCGPGQREPADLPHRHPDAGAGAARDRSVPEDGAPLRARRAAGTTCRAPGRAPGRTRGEARRPGS